MVQYHNLRITACDCKVNLRIIPFSNMLFREHGTLGDTLHEK